MAFTANLNPCAYLRSSTSYVFAGDRAELVHINEKISSLDHHISQLNTLRNALLHRSRQIHNLLAPVHNLPVEVLSYIFQHVVYSADPVYYVDDAWCDLYDSERHLCQAFVLSSVSAHFRHVALGIRNLWNQVPFRISHNNGIDKTLTLLRHCTTLAPDVNVTVYDSDECVTEEAIKALLTSDDMQKVTVFDLSQSEYPTDPWITQLVNSSFPLLNSLILCYEGEGTIGLDLRNLSALTHLDIQGPRLGHPIFVPSSVQQLHIDYGSPSTVVSLFYQCPNLVKCFAEIDLDDDFSTAENLDPGTLFTKPLTLTYLEQLTLRGLNCLEMSSSVEKLCLPSLEYLHFTHEQWREFTGVVSLCRNASATLVVLIIDLAYDASDYSDLYQLCRLHLPKLRRLEVRSSRWSPIPSIICALALTDGECCNAKLPHLPSLEIVTLRCHAEVEPQDFLDVLGKWNIGVTFCFHMEFKVYQLSDQDWTPALRKELASIVGKRRVKVTWDKHQIL